MSLSFILSFFLDFFCRSFLLSIYIYVCVCVCVLRVCVFCVCVCVLMNSFIFLRVDKLNKSTLAHRILETAMYIAWQIGFHTLHFPCASYATLRWVVSLVYVMGTLAQGCTWNGMKPLPLCHARPTRMGMMTLLQLGATARPLLHA